MNIDAFLNNRQTYFQYNRFIGRCLTFQNFCFIPFFFVSMNLDYKNSTHKKKDYRNSNQTVSFTVSNQDKYILVESACNNVNDVINNYNPSDEKSHKALKNTLEAFNQLLDQQKILQMKQNIEITITNLLDIIYDPRKIYYKDHVSEALLALSLLFKSENTLSKFASNDLVAYFCTLVNEKQFPEMIGSIIDIIRNFIDYNHDFIKIVIEILPFERIFQLAQENINRIKIFSIIYYDIIDFMKISFDDQNTFFNFIDFCYKNNLTKSYRYNIWSLISLIQYKDNFNFCSFNDKFLMQFIDNAIVQSSNQIVTAALHFIEQLYKYYEPPFPINIENLIVIPQYRDDLNNSTKLLDLMILDKIFRKDISQLKAFFFYKLDHFLIEYFFDAELEYKKVVFSLLNFIILYLNSDKLEEMIHDGMLGIFCEFCVFFPDKYDALFGLKYIIDNVGKSPQFGMYAILLQDEMFQSYLDKLVQSPTLENDQSDIRKAEAIQIAQYILNLTNDEELDYLKDV